MCGPWTMTPWLQQSAPRGRVGSTRGEYQQLLRHHKAQRHPQQPSLQMDPAHQRPQLAVEFHRSAGISIPPIRAHVMRCRSDQDGGIATDRAHAPVSSAPSCGDHAANARDNEFSRRIGRARPFFTGTGSPPSPGLSRDVEALKESCKSSRGAMVPRRAFDTRGAADGA